VDRARLWRVESGEWRAVDRVEERLWSLGAGLCREKSLGTLKTLTGHVIAYVVRSGSECRSEQ
jgi:hypothetical protein